jgi:hypothetical protein
MDLPHAANKMAPNAIIVAEIFSPVCLQAKANNGDSVRNVHGYIWTTVPVENHNGLLTLYLCSVTYSVQNALTFQH